MLSKSRRVLVTVLIATVSIIGGLSVKVYADTDASFTRISGQDRYETAIQISKKGWNHSDVVVLAYGGDFPDGLTGVTLAYLKDAPILLTSKDILPKSTLSEMKRLDAKIVYILGGTGVVSASIEQQLNLLNYDAKRISGLDRFKTAIEVGNTIKNNNTDTAVIATGYNFPDALAIGPAAAKNNMPILFTDKDNLTFDTKQALIGWSIKKVVIVGGTGVVSSEVEDQIKELGISVERLSGEDRYVTSLNIAKRFNSDNINNVILAKGEDFPDALSGGALAAKNDFLIILTSKENVSYKIISYFDELKAQDIYILGGIGAISDNVKDSIKKGTLGSLPANIYNGGYAVKEGDWIYYCQYDPTANTPFAPNNSSINRMKSDGSNKTKLLTAYANDLNIKGDWLYYTNKGDYNNNEIYKVKIDGSNNQSVSSHSIARNLIIVGDWIYALEYHSWSIIKISLDGSYYEFPFWASPLSFVISGDTLYFTRDGSDDSIWKSNSLNTKLNDEPSFNINLYRDNIYFIDSKFNICSITTNGDNKTILGADKTNSIIVDEGWIYYINKNDNDKLYKMKIDATSRVKVSDLVIPSFNIVGDWVVYVSNAQTHFIKK